MGMRGVETVPAPARQGQRARKDDFIKAEIHSQEVGPPQGWTAGGRCLCGNGFVHERQEKGH